jgi:hypothetical protein
MVRAAASRVGLCAGYLLTAVAVTAVWMWCARTEYGTLELEVRLPSGERYTSRFCSIVRLAEGRAFSPFVKRRLLPDLARLLAWTLPDRCWSGMRQVLRDPVSAPGWLRAFLERQQWKPEDWPLLGSAYFLIFASVLGFMLTCRWLVRLLYEAPPWVGHLAAFSFGVALLGGYGDWHYCGYPYDFPNAFIFALALAALIARRWWLPIAFAVAAYSKETSVLLLGADLLLADQRRSLRFWLRLGLMALLWLLIRWWIDRHYITPTPEQGFWFPGRNLKMLAVVFFSNWWLPFLAVGLLRMAALRRQYPPALVRLCWLVVPLVGLAFFKGWLEEMRQYLELLPVFGLLLFHWVLHEVGLGQHLQPRAADSQAHSAPPLRSAA